MKPFLLLMYLCCLSTVVYSAPEPTIEITHACDGTLAEISYSYADAEEYQIQWSLEGESPQVQEPGAGTLKNLEPGTYEFYLLLPGKDEYTFHGPYYYDVYDLTPKFTWAQQNNCNKTANDVELTVSLNTVHSGVNYMAYLKNQGGQVLLASPMLGRHHTFKGLTTGNYWVEITANGSSCSYTKPISVQDESNCPAVPDITITHACHEEPAQLSYSYDGEEYMIQWSVDGSVPQIMQPGAGVLTDIEPGKYEIYLLLPGKSNYIYHGPYYYNVYNITPIFTWSELNNCNGVVGDAAVVVNLNAQHAGITYMAYLKNANGQVLQSSVVTGGQHMFTGLSAGNYFVEVTANGEACSYGLGITVADESFPINVSTMVKTCHDLGGSIDVQIPNFQTGQQYTVQVKNLANSQTISYQQTTATHILPNIAVGTYELSVNNGSCSATQQVTVEEVRVEVLATAFRDGGCTWKFKANMLGGATAAHYTWELKDNSGNQINPIVVTNSEIYVPWSVGLSWGRIRATTVDGCVYEQSLDIPSTILFPNGGPQVTPTNLICGGAQGALLVNFENASSNFIVNNISLEDATGNILQTLPVSNGTEFITFHNLAVGAYYIRVNTASSCHTDNLAIGPFDIMEDKFEIEAVSKPYCEDGNFSQIELISPIGTGYNYQWKLTNGTDLVGETSPILNIGDHTPGATTGFYILEVTHNGCTVQKTFSVSRFVYHGVITNNNIICGTAGTKLTLSPSHIPSNDPPYTFEIFTNQWYASDTFNEGEIGEIWIAKAGSYPVRVVSNTGCIMEWQQDITEDPLPIDIQATPPTTCHSNDGVLSASVPNGSGSFTYAWSTGASTQSISGLSHGTTYSVTISQDTCSGTASYTLDETAIKVVAEGSWDGPVCSSNNGTLSVTLPSSIASHSLSYEWWTYINNNYTLVGTTAQLTNMPEGDYNLKVSDNSTTPSCVYTSTKKIRSSWIVGTVQTERLIDCHNGQVGFRLLNYDDYVDCASIDVKIEKVRISDQTKTTQIITMDRNGSHEYWWSMTAAADPDIEYHVIFTPCCNINATTADTFSYADIYPSITTSISPANCHQSGRVTITTTGINAPYQCIWEDGFIGNHRTDLVAGSYGVSIMGSGGCFKQETITIPGTSGRPHLINTHSCGGEIEVNAANIANGTAPYQLSWTFNNGATQQAAAPVVLDQVGIYVLEITDANGCIGTETVELKPEVFEITPQIHSVSCLGNDGRIALSVVNNSSSMRSYTWIGPNGTTYTGHSLQGLSAGTYNYVATDARGCTRTGAVVVNSRSNLTVNFVPNCLPKITISGGQAPYQVFFEAQQNHPTQATYTLNLPLGTNYPYSLYNLDEGNYLVTITDANGCITTTSLNTISTSTATRSFNIKMRWKRHAQPVVIGEVKSPEAELIKDDLMQQANNFLKDADRLGGGEHCQKMGDDALSLGYDLDLHHYTLYYYNLKDELVRTVPPEGVAFLSGTDLDNVVAWRADKTAATNLPSTPIVPNHNLVTQYEYNALGQQIENHSPDKGTSTVLYSSKGLLRFSQNAQQQIDGAYSYVLYDALQRVVETGEMLFAGTPSLTQLDDLDVLPTGATKDEWVKNYYNDAHLLNGTKVAYYHQIGQEQQYLRNRISYTENHQGVVTTYSYDIHGNVQWLRQFTPNLGENFIAYDYDLISNIVQQVRYNEFSEDRFFHKYTYDAQKRIKEVYTSVDGIIWDRDANYNYYAHGPLQRTELGDDKIQGLDYVYTIHGWIKAVNHPFMHQLGTTPSRNTHDPNKDGFEGSPVMKDVFGYALGYYHNDYTRNLFINPIDYSGSNSLYNGNIAAWSNGVDQQALTISSGNSFSSSVDERLTQRNFSYDELNRIKTSHLLAVDAADPPNMLPTTGAYQTTYTYDGNGNIQTLQRAGSSAALIDDLTYHYGNGSLKNRLEYILDAKGNQGSGDLDARQEYSYDAIGNIIASVQKDNGGSIQEQMNVEWRVDGKVKQVNIHNFVTGIQSTIEFVYDASGNRVAKIYDPNINQSNDEISTYHVRDATGNILASYQKTYNGTNFNISLKERNLFGSARLGMQTKSHTFIGAALERRGESIAYGLRTRIVDKKVFELADHLGNVTMLLSDQKLKGIDGYQAKIVNYQQYYPFGWSAPGRQFKAHDYRFGFNGKENDQEWGNQLIQDYGFRLYNPAIAKFLSVDPLAPEYPFYSPYHFAGNTPIWARDLDGLEPDYTNETFYRYGGHRAILNELYIRWEDYDGNAIAFGTGETLTRAMLFDDIGEAAEGVKEFDFFGYDWAQRNLNKYLWGTGGVDIYGYSDLSNARSFRSLIRTTKSDLSARIARAMGMGTTARTWLSGPGFCGQCGANYTVTNESATISRSYSYVEQSGKSDFSLAIGAAQLFANVSLNRITRDEEGRATSFSGIAYYTFFDTYDWGPGRRGGIFKFAMGIADHWEMNNIQAIGARIFWSRGYFHSSVSGTIDYDENGEAKFNIKFGEIWDSPNSFLRSHPEPVDGNNPIPANTETTYDGRK